MSATAPWRTLGAGEEMWGGALSEADDVAVILGWEESFRHHYIKPQRAADGHQREPQHDRFGPEHAIERPFVCAQHQLEQTLKIAQQDIFFLAVIALENPRAQHRRRRQRDKAESA